MDPIKMRSATVLRWFLGLAVGLPMLIIVLQFGGTLLLAMGDEAPAGVLRAIGLAFGVAWVVVLLGLLLTAAVVTLSRLDQPERSHKEE